MEKISETDFSEIYLDDENDSIVIKFKNKEDYPHFKTVLGTVEGLTVLFKSFYEYYYKRYLKMKKDETWRRNIRPHLIRRKWIKEDSE